MSSAACPSENVLLEWLAGQLPSAGIADLEAHLDICAGCREVVHQANNEGAIVPPSAKSTRDSPSPLECGTAIGRYRVLELLGRGGMGIVYAAYDPELDRQVALKLLHADAEGSAQPARDTAARLRREAQAMAQLSHPNVVTVFDVGVANGQLFIAMELIDGTNLARRRDEPRPIGEILKQFIAAGRGLEAAHAAGFVHRDFKPANLLVGRDGRVCVSDFGLARLIGGAAPAPASSRAAPALPANSLTRTGALVGTPQYMAPEQLRGESADARADQFSFCVALYEALYGERPFSGTSFDELKAHVQAGKVRPAPRGSRVPSRLRRALLRGLRVDPNRRFPSMTMLLRAIAPPAPWTRLFGAAGLFGIAALAFASYLAVKQQRSVCGDGADHWLRIWDSRAKARVHAAFRRTGSASAEAAWRTVERGLDGLADAWVQSYRESCAATRVRGEQSAALYELRQDCLNRALDHAAALISLFAQADALLIDRAPQAVHVELASCASVTALRQRRGPPTDPVARAAYETLQRRLAEVNALIDLGRFGEGNQAIGLLVEDAKRLGHPLLMSDAYRFQGLLELQKGTALAAERSFHAAAAAAEQGGDDQRAALAWDSLALAAAEAGHFEDATLWLDQAAAAAERAGRDPVLAESHRHCVDLVEARRAQHSQAVEADHRDR
jgi:hypothetical protein